MHEPSMTLLSQMEHAIKVASEGRSQDYGSAIFIVARMIDICGLPEGEELPVYLKLMKYIVETDIKPAACGEILTDIKIYEPKLDLGPQGVGK